MLLAFDTCFQACSVALTEAGALLASERQVMARGHAEALMPMIARVLERVGETPAAVSRIAVTVGPGSFTGVRVGVAAARGLALANGCPAAGFSTLEVIAAGAIEQRPDTAQVLATVAARGEEVYHQRFAIDRSASWPLRPQTEPAVSSLDSVPAAGDATVYAGAAARQLADRAGVDNAMVIDDLNPDAVLLARLAEQAPDERWASSPRPLYVRPPDAKPQRAPLGADQ